MALIKSLLVTLFLFLGVAAVHGNDDIRQLLDHQGLMLIRLQNELTSLKAANQEQQTKIHQLEEALHKSKNDAVGKLVAKPTSCRDISNIGTQTSGYYLVQGLSGKALDAVFCDFSLPIAEWESRIGPVDVKTTPVYFYVQRSTPLSASPGSIIPWSTAQVNVGNGMDLITGVFKAPVNGTYYFSFSGIKGNATGPTSVRLRRDVLLNVGKAYADGLSNQLTLSLSATLKLGKGEEVFLLLESGVLYDDENNFSHFSGFLLEEDLAL